MFFECKSHTLYLNSGQKFGQSRVCVKRPTEGMLVKKKVSGDIHIWRYRRYLILFLSIGVILWICSGALKLLVPSSNEDIILAKDEEPTIFLQEDDGRPKSGAFLAKKRVEGVSEYSQGAEIANSTTKNDPSTDEKNKAQPTQTTTRRTTTTTTKRYPSSIKEEKKKTPPTQRAQEDSPSWRKGDFSLNCDKDPVDGDLLPVFFFHGIRDNASEAGVLFRNLHKRGRPTYACSIPLYEDADSLFVPILKQAQSVEEYIRHYTRQKNLKAYQLVCHSMGALTCRAVLQQMEDHRAENVILMAGTLQGVYGEIQRNPLTQFALRVGHPLITTHLAQTLLAPANLIHDPIEFREYEQYNMCIPILDGYRKEGEDEEATLKRVERYKKNWQKIKQIYLLASSADDLVVPWQTAHFGFFKKGSTSKNKILSFAELKVDETLGLSEMEKDGRLKLITVEGVSHTDWTYNEQVVLKHVVPLLAFGPTTNLSS